MESKPASTSLTTSNQTLPESTKSTCAPTAGSATTADEDKTGNPIEGL